jgi:glycosyltransferase involved in cell wall biosynthesis
MGKKKLLFYYKLFFAGGTEHSILKHIKKLYKNFDIYVAYDEEETTGIVLDKIAEYAIVLDLNNINSINVDTCIWCSHSRQGSFSDFSKKVIANRYLYWCHIVMFETFPNFEFTEDLMNGIEKFICVSNVVKNDIVKKYPKLSNKCIVIENYLDENDIINSSNEFDFEVPKDSLNIVSVSRIAKDKGFGRMKVMCDILDKNNINYNWYVLGKAFTQDVKDEIEGMFTDNKKVHFLGYKDNTYPYVKKMDYLALLTDRESWGLVITEALMLNVPCIVTNFPGVEEQITDTQNGIILNMNNENNLYEKRIKDILELKYKLKENISKQNKNRDYIIDTWIELLNRDYIIDTGIELEL